MRRRGAAAAWLVPWPAILLPLLCLAPCSSVMAQQQQPGSTASPAAAPAAAGASPPAPEPALQPSPLLPANASGAPSDGSKLIFCVADWEPVAMCDSEHAQYTADNFTGHDVQLVRQAATVLGLTEGTDFEFKCDSFSTMTKSLLNSSGPCSAAVSFVTITTERQASGIKFTYPYFKSSLSTLVQATKSTGTGWGFVRPFSWDLWLALLVTLIVVPPIIFVVEFLSLRKAIHRGDVLPGLIESGWRSTLTLMLMDSFAVTSQGARVAVLCFCFLALLTTSTYTANLAAFVTVNTIASRITSVGDLRGRAVGTSPIYIERLLKYGIQGIPYPFNNGSDYLVWRDLVSSGTLAAMVRDTPALQWLADTAPLCDVAVLPQQLEPFDYGMAFHMNASQALVDAWSRAILELQEDGTLQQLKDSWIVSPNDGCLASADVNNNANAVSFSDLYGLWIILGAGLALGTVIMLAQRTVRRYRKHHGDGVVRHGDGPLPDFDQTPRNLVTAVVEKALGKKRRKGLSRSGMGGNTQKGGRQGRKGRGGAAQNGARGGAAAVGVYEASPASGGAAGWDLESGSSMQPPSPSDMDPSHSMDYPAGTAGTAGTPTSGASLPPAAAGTPAAATPRGVAAAVSPRRSPPSPPPSARGEQRQDSRPRSALQAADSIYGGLSWKSEMKTGAAWGE